MEHIPSTNGNCAACSQLFNGAGRRRVEPWPCPVVLLAREQRKNATLREQVEILSRKDADRTSELRAEIDRLRDELAKHPPRPFPPALGEYIQQMAVRCVDFMERRCARPS